MARARFMLVIAALVFLTAPAIAQTAAPALSALQTAVACAAPMSVDESKGKTPHATLHAAMGQEIKEKGKEARFTKKDGTVNGERRRTPR